MSDAAGAAPVEFDDQNRIAGDLPCVDCDYNLRTQQRDGRCPECGAPIPDSIKAHAQTGWYSRTRLRWFQIGVAMMLAWLVTLIAVVIHAVLSGPNELFSGTRIAAHSGFVIGGWLALGRVRLHTLPA